MKCTRFFLLLLFIPNMIYAGFYAKEYAKVMDKIKSEWNHHDELIQQFSRLSDSEKEQGIDLLRRAIKCCQKAIDHCDSIIKHIDDKPKSERHDSYWVQAKERSKQDKQHLNAEIASLQTAINQTLQNSAFAKALSFYQQAQEKAALAEMKSQICTRDLDDVDTTVATFNEIAELYTQALVFSQHALAFIAPYPDEVSKDTLRQAIALYSNAAQQYRQEAAAWPATVQTEKNALNEELTSLTEKNSL